MLFCARGLPDKTTTSLPDVLSAATTRARPIAQSLREYARGITGGLIFSLPLLYTMEVWWAGFTSQPERLLVYMAATFLLLLGYNRYAGMRRDATWWEVAIDSVEEMGLGLLTAALILVLLGQLNGEMRVSEVTGKLVMEAMTVAIGISVGTAQLGGGEGRDGEDKGVRKGGAAKDETRFLGQLVIGLCGAVLFAANVAPTEEVVVIAHAVSSWHLVALALLSLALGVLILFYSEFRGAKRFVTRDGVSHVWRMSAITYASALVASALILWFFGRLDGEPLITCLGETVVLGVAATLGASAGRLLLQ